MENLQRWKSSGQSEAWVRAHMNGWNHEDWLGLLADLRNSQYWPMEEAAIGQHLEGLRAKLISAPHTNPDAIRAAVPTEAPASPPLNYVVREYSLGAGKPKEEPASPPLKSLQKSLVEYLAGGSPEEALKKQPDKCERCGALGHPPKVAALYGEPIPFDVKAMDTGREKRYWLCMECYMWASQELRQRGSVTVISR